MKPPVTTVVKAQVCPCVKIIVTRTWKGETSQSMTTFRTPVTAAKAYCAESTNSRSLQGKITYTHPDFELRKKRLYRRVLPVFKRMFAQQCG